MKEFEARDKLGAISSGTVPEVTRFCADTAETLLSDLNIMHAAYHFTLPAHFQ